MKNTLTTAAICLLFSSLSFGQKLSADKVPAAVKAKFTELYPKVTEVKWEMEKSDYEAGFKEGSTEVSVVIDAAGNLKETESEIPVAQLPKAATDYLAKKYPGAKVAEAAKITDAAGKVNYEAEVNKKDVLFDEKGNFVK